MFTSIRHAFLCSAALLGLAGICQAITYNCSPITIPGANVVVAKGINDSGTIVGNYQANSIEHGFISNPGTGYFQTVDFPQPPGSTNTQLTAINNNNVSLGYWQNTQNGTSGYFTLDSAGNFIPISTPSGYTSMSVYGINDNGAISGLFGNASVLTFGILNPDGTVTPVPGYSTAMGGGEQITVPGSLNNAGQMMESSVTYGGANLASPSGIIVNLQYADFSTYGYGVNNVGTVVGYGFGFLHEPPYFDFTYDLTSQTYSPALCPNYTSGTQPGFFGINDSGVLVGYAIATPLPGSAQFSISTTSVTFPATPVGQTTAPQPLTITNTGNARLDMYASGQLVIGNQSSSTAVFKADTGCFSSSGAVTSLDPGASCTTMITATPSQQGQQTITESVTDSAPGAPHSFTLSVTGTLPPPTCQVSSTGTGQASLTMQDTNSGLKSITLYSENNATVNIPSFPSGDTSPVTATATQNNLSLAGQVTLQATNVAGASTMCTATFSGSSGPPQWMGTGGSITGRITVLSNANGTLQAFARGTDNALWTNAQTSPDGTWGTWTSLGGVLSSDPAAGLNGNGDLEAFVLGSDGSLWTIAQSSPGGAFGGWQGLGQTLTSDPAVTADSSGNLHVFAVGSDHALWTIAETTPGSWGGWTSLGGAILHNPAVITNTNGSLEVFVVGTDNAIWHNWTVDAAFDWAGWSSLGGVIAGSPVAVLYPATGTVAVVALGNDSSIRYAFHLAGGDWTSFVSIGGYAIGDPAASFSTQGALIVFVRGGDNALWYDAIFGSDTWTTLGGTLAGSPAAAINQDGRIAAFVEGTDTSVWTIEESAPNSWR